MSLVFSQVTGGSGHTQCTEAELGFWFISLRVFGLTSVSLQTLGKLLLL